MITRIFLFIVIVRQYKFLENFTCVNRSFYTRRNIFFTNIPINLYLVNVNYFIYFSFNVKSDIRSFFLFLFLLFATEHLLKNFLYLLITNSFSFDLKLLEKEKKRKIS